MSQSVALLGRQPALGLAELESLYGGSVSRISNHAALIDLPTDQVNFNRLGGSIKLAKLLTILDFTDWQKIEDYLVANIPEHISNLDTGKITLGLSVYGLNINPRRINATGLTLKKVIKTTGRPVRIVPNKSAELSSAQVLHNKLFGGNNWELLLIVDGKQTYLAQTTNVQNIDAYAARDQARPARDAKVGMLPPKLAQIIVNLAVGNPEFRIQNSEFTVLDPFCGTGVVLQEAILMGYKAFGTDIDQRMVDYSKTNLLWLNSEFGIRNSEFKTEVGDATSFDWDISQLTANNSLLVIACETYLGRPFSALPDTETLRKVMGDVDSIHKKFLQNVAKQTKPGFGMCIAVPAWKTRYGFTHLKVLDNLSDLGYTRAVFKTVRSSDLIYHREGQVVGRELVVLRRK